MNRFVRIVAVLLSALLLGGTGSVIAAAPASATVTVLCKGYTACNRAGMSDSGYAAASRTMYWRMYSGHNCTNYAAYRMVKAGLPNVRPWSGGGNATYWGTKMATITNSTPAVGAVAWWRAYASPAGSAGHVAYVERVVSADEIIVSQDSWGGDFAWTRVTRASKGWPSGFVHFRDVTRSNTAAPVVSGQAKVGSTLSTTSGSWTPSGAAYAYQWLQNGAPIAGATGTTLAVTQALTGKTISVRVTATQLGYPTTSAVSAATAAVLPGTISSTAAPTVSGEARVDQVLTAGPGSWNPQPDGVQYQWRADGVPVAGATAPTLTVAPQLVGKALTVAVTAARSGYKPVTATSAATAPVEPGVLDVTGTPTVSGALEPGGTLAVALPGALPRAAATEVQWLRAGVPVPGATGSTYRLTSADLGRRILAQVRLTRPGYTPVTTSTAWTGPVKATPRLRVATRTTGRQVTITVTASALGAPPVAGLVLVRAHGRLLRTVSMRNGVATTTVTGLRPGRWSFRIGYPATRTLEDAVAVHEVRIR